MSKSRRYQDLWIVPAVTGVVIAAAVSAVLGTFSPAQAEALVLYSGRSKALVDPLVRRFAEETGIEVKVKYGKTAQLAVALQEEGAQSPADVFWSQDAGALGALVSAQMLVPLESQTLERVPAAYRGTDGLWIATSGRARVLAYSLSPVRVNTETLPASVFDLTDTRFKGRVGWAPTNASFQGFVTAMRKTHGQDIARDWLLGMIENQAQVYPKNTAIIQAIAAGEVDFGLPNHYYLLRFKAQDEAYPVGQTFFEPGDIGNLVNVAGAGVLKASKHNDTAQRFVAFLVSEESQAYFAHETFEYPVIKGLTSEDKTGSVQSLAEDAPAVDLDTLEDLQGTLDLLAEVGLR
jgi:iron(III) transport system substrate-binding protein